jgi:hypothetical protein
MRLLAWDYLPLRLTPSNNGPKKSGFTGAFLVAWLTMSFQSIKAATSNPVNALGSE